MEKAQSEIDIDRPADEVWAVVGDFGGIGFMPGVESVVVDGDVRTVGTMGIEVQEKLVSRDDATRTISYSIIAGPVPVEHHQATISVEPTGDGSHVTWAVETDDADSATFFNSVYEGALTGLKSHCEG
jgi:carbon monoxide dehydrogenase subunit G